jgi:hypothetical protein
MLARSRRIVKADLSLDAVICLITEVGLRVRNSAIGLPGIGTAAPVAELAALPLRRTRVPRGNSITTSACNLR